MRILRLIAAGAVLVGTFWFIHRFAYQRYQCHLQEVRLQASTTEVIEDRQALDRHSRSRRHLQEIAGCVEKFPWNVNLYMIQGANLRLLGRDADALISYRKGLQFDVRPEIFLNLGITESLTGSQDEAEWYLTVAALTSAFSMGDSAPSHLIARVGEHAHELHDSIADGSISEEDLRRLRSTLSPMD